MHCGTSAGVPRVAVWWVWLAYWVGIGCQILGAVVGCWVWCWVRLWACRGLWIGVVCLRGVGGSGWGICPIGDCLGAVVGVPMVVVWWVRLVYWVGIGYQKLCSVGVMLGAVLGVMVSAPGVPDGAVWWESSAKVLG